MSEYTYENLAFEGGGVKGVVYLGCIKALKELDKIKDVKRVIGTSVGSLCGLLLVSDCTNNEMDIYMTKLIESLSSSENFISKTTNLFNKFGFNDVNNVRDNIDILLNLKFQNEKITLKELYDKTQIEFTIVATNLTDNCVEYFNHITYPDVYVSDAICASIAVPFYFTSVKINNKIYVDGGVCDNFPIDYYDADNGLHNDKTLGFHIISNSKSGEINNIIEFIKHIELTQLNNNIVQSIEKIKNRNIINIDVGDLNTFDFSVVSSLKDEFINLGYNQTISYFDKKRKLNI